MKISSLFPNFGRIMKVLKVLSFMEILPKYKYNVTFFLVRIFSGGIAWTTDIKLTFLK